MNDSDKTPKISPEQWKAQFAKPEKKNKYNAQRTLVDGKHFQSKLEAAVYMKLKAFESGGAIKNLKCHPTVTFPDEKKTKWMVDFYAECALTGIPEYHEAKGAELPDYKRKVKIWGKYGPATLYIWMGSAKDPHVVKVLIPQTILDGRNE